MESRDISKVFIRRKKNAVCVDRHMGWLRDRIMPWWQFKSLYRAFLPGFPSVNHSDLPGSEFRFGVSQDPPMLAHTSLSPDGFQ